MYQEITIQLTPNCNLQCPYCFAETTNNGFISDSDIELFIEMCEKEKPDCIHITGGEPALHPCFGEIVSRLVKISPLVIYTNMTVKNAMETIFAENPSDIFILANLNERDLYNDSQWAVFCENIEAVNKKGMRLAIGHTFFKRPFRNQFKQIIEFSMKANATHLRLSQAVRSHNNSVGLDSEQIEELYSYVASNIDRWFEMGLKTYFDCPVPLCYISKESLDILQRYNAINTYCMPKAFVTWDLQVTHCYTTLGLDTNTPKLSEFESIQSMKEYSSELLKKSYVNRNNYMCERCQRSHNKDMICGCPSYLT